MGAASLGVRPAANISKARCRRTRAPGFIDHSSLTVNDRTWPSGWLLRATRSRATAQRAGLATAAAVSLPRGPPSHLSPARADDSRFRPLHRPPLDTLHFI